MKILLISQYFWPESFRINELVDGLADAGCEITVLTGQPNYPEGKLFNGYKVISFRTDSRNGYPILRVPMLPRNKAMGYQLILNYLSFVISASIFAPYRLRKKKFDVILVYAPSPILQIFPGIILKKLRKVPLITWVGDLWPQSLISTGFVKNPVLLRMVEKLVGYLYRSNDLLLVQSRPFMEPVKRNAGDVPVDYLPNPGERMFGSLNNEGAAPAYRLNKGFNIIFAGNLGSVQSLPMVIKAAEILRNDPEITIYLFGSGSMVEEIIRQISDLNLTNVILPGRFSPDTMPLIFKQADALLVALVKDETMSLTVPSKIQSYMASGRPILAALDGEGAQIVVEASAGLASPAEDAEALARNILHLKNLPKIELERMGDNGFNYYMENFELKKLVGGLIKRIGTLKHHP